MVLYKSLDTSISGSCGYSEVSQSENSNEFLEKPEILKFLDHFQRQKIGIKILPPSCARFLWHGEGWHTVGAQQVFGH